MLRQWIQCIRWILLTPVRIFRARIVPGDSACTEVAGAFLMKPPFRRGAVFGAFVTNRGTGTPLNRLTCFICRSLETPTAIERRPCRLQLYETRPFLQSRIKSRPTSKNISRLFFVIPLILRFSLLRCDFVPFILRFLSISFANFVRPVGKGESFVAIESFVKYFPL